MAERKKLQDVVPVRVRRVSTSERASVSARPAPKRESSTDQAPFRHFKKPKKRHGKKVALIITALVCIGVIALAISSLYAKAIVLITPKVEHVAVNGIFNATADGTSSTTLLYEVVETTKEASVPIISTQGPLIQKKASGIIMLYNAFSTSSQKIIEGTHLTNTKGLTYLTAQTVIVPGIKKPTAPGQATTTGSIQVWVVADKPGAEYNISPSDLTGDFKITAYQGTPKANGFYGRLKADKIIAGGYLGYQQIVASTTLAAAESGLNNSISNDLTASLKNLVPEGYIMYDGGYTITFASSTLSESALTKHATLLGIMFKKTDLARAIAPKQMSSFGSNTYDMSQLESLQFALVKPKLAGGPILFSMSGAFTLTGTFPKDTLSNALAGLDAAQSKAIFARYSTIVNAHAIITPFWKHSFPDSPEKITITIQP